MAPASYHRMRQPERCEECSTRLWYEQEGLRYCKNGHQLEGFASHDIGEDGFGATGKVSRVKREKRQRPPLKLEGAAGKRLYLEVLQLVLRKQAWWLVKEKRFPDALEAVAKGIWAYRVSICDDAVEGVESGHGFSSSGQSSAEHSDASLASQSTRTAGGVRGKLPGLIDTLAVCYLSCNVLRLPVTTADFHKWAMEGDIEFLAAINNIPKSVRDRLPSKFHRSLQVKDSIKPGKLLDAAQEMAISLNINCDINFMPLNHVPILIHHIERLTLPIEIYLMVKCLADLLQADFSFPKGTLRRIRSMDNPEVLLMTLVLVATKLLHPLDGVERPPVSDDDPRTKQINWKEWQDARKKQPPALNDGLRKGSEHKVTANEALTMDEKKMDDFMDWFENMWIRDGDEPKTAPSIREPFQDRGTVPRAQTNAVEDPTNDDEALIKEKYDVIYGTMRFVEPQIDPEPVNGRRKRPERDFCPVWRTEYDLPEAAKVLYQEAADLAAIPLRTLITAAVQVERRVEIWSAEEGRAKKRETVDPNGKRKAVPQPGENSNQLYI